MTGDITSVKRELTNRAQAAAEYLLPQGRREAGEWRAGSIDGEPGRSLGVHLTGAKAGIWADFNGGAGGDLLDLWAQVRRCDLATAIKQAREWLGMSRPEPYREPRKAYQRPPKPKCHPPQARVLDYLREDRCIPPEVISAYNIGEAGDEIVFPFLLPDGVLAMVKTRKAEDGAKPKPTTYGCESVLFGWQFIPSDARKVTITEGEIDALAMAAYGWPALSVPFGGGGGKKQQWIENEFERMDRFEQIYLALDMDKPGDEAAEAIADRLGRHRCLRVALPRKDADQCRMEGVPKDEIDAAIAGAKHLDPDGLKRASEYADNVIALFWPAHEDMPGYRMPYGKFGDKLLFRPSEVTLWTGDSGAGKSQLLSDCNVAWIEQGSRVCLSSLEMRPEQTLKRMCKQVSGVDRPSSHNIREALRFLDRGLILYDRVGKAGIDGLLDVFAFSRAKYGCDQFIIDSLMRLGIAGDDYTGQEKVMFRIVDWALSTNAHVHLVAHSRKGDKDRGVPEANDIKGASEIGNNAFNIVAVWRNRKLEDDIRAAQSDEDLAKLAELKKKPGVIVNVAKQRNGDFEGKIGLWFDQASYRYRSEPDIDYGARAYIDIPETGMEVA